MLPEAKSENERNIARFRLCVRPGIRRDSSAASDSDDVPASAAAAAAAATVRRFE